MPRHGQVERGSGDETTMELSLVPRHGLVERGSGDETTMSLVSCPDMCR